MGMHNPVARLAKFVRETLLRNKSYLIGTSHVPPAGSIYQDMS